MRALVGFAEANHENPVQTTLLFDALTSTATATTIATNSRLPLITYGTTDVTDPATWTLTQIRLRPQSTINSYPDRDARLEWAASDSVLAEVRSAVEELHLQVDRTAPFQRNDGQPSKRDSSESRPRSAATATSPTSATASNVPAGSVTTWLIPDLIAAVDALRAQQPRHLPDGHRACARATTTRSKKTTWARTSRAISASNLALTPCAATSACATSRRT